jgi:chromosome segregation ATPase
LANAKISEVSRKLEVLSTKNKLLEETNTKAKQLHQDAIDEIKKQHKNELGQIQAKLDFSDDQLNQANQRLQLLQNTLDQQQEKRPDKTSQQVEQEVQSHLQNTIDQQSTIIDQRTCFLFFLETKKYLTFFLQWNHRETQQKRQ